MKFTIEKGQYKTSKYLFIFTGIFLIILFCYQLINLINERPFKSEFPGDWDKVICIGIGIYLIFRSSVFKIRSRDIFIEVTDSLVKYRIDKTKPIATIRRSDIDNFEIKKGKVNLMTKESEKITIIDFNKMRIRDEKRESITKSLKEQLSA